MGFQGQQGAFSRPAPRQSAQFHHESLPPRHWHDDFHQTQVPVNDRRMDDHYFCRRWLSDRNRALVFLVEAACMETTRLGLWFDLDNHFHTIGSGLDDCL